ncbi:TetR/AcrR family transcriptional regulator [Neisseriaceae bacterium TC5R-5]|nr:TetR/AcrR family transcriptional regulator [Neisseriaceae bacterium TC5R-5]
MKHFSELSPSAERIVDAAEELIRNVGYNGFSFENIAQMVGVKKPSIHHHFATKVELGVVMVQRYSHRFRQALLHIEGTMSKAPDRLKAYAELFDSTYRQNHAMCVCGMLSAESTSLAELINAEVERFFQINLAWLTEVITQGLTDGSLHSNQTADQLAEIMLALLEGAMVVGRGLKFGRGPRKTVEVFLSTI